MTAFDVMQSLRGAGDEIQSMRETIEMRKDAVASITAGYGESGGHGSGETDRMAAYAARVEELEKRLSERREAQRREAELCLDLCEQLEGVNRTVLYSYYLKSWTLDAIATSSGFTPGYVRRKKKELDEWLKTIDTEIEVQYGD